MSGASRNIDIYLSFSIASTIILGAVPIITNSFRNHLPLNLWYPFNTSKTGFHDFAYFYECIGITIRASTHVATDSLPLLLMTFVCGQLDAITDTLRNLKSYARQDIQMNEKRGISDEQVYKGMNALLVECVQKHIEVRRLVQELHDAYSYHFFSILANAILVLSLVLSKIATESKLLSLVDMLLYFCAIALQLLQFNWYGNEIALKSSAMHMAAYAMDWSECPITFKKKLLFALIHLQKPLKYRTPVNLYLGIETMLVLFSGFTSNERRELNKKGSRLRFHTAFVRLAKHKTSREET
ncbi:hypothetical protein Trydic_g6034 [Trypoxylus dichotomus]